MSTSVYGITKSDIQAHALVTSLMGADFRIGDISVLFQCMTDPRFINNKRGVNYFVKSSDCIISVGIIGGALAGMVGIGEVEIPGVGSYIAAGPIVEIFGSAAIVAASGSVAGVLINMGMSELNARHFQDRINEGNILIFAHADNGEWACRARNIFENNGINDVRSSGKTDSDIAWPVSVAAVGVRATSPNSRA